MQIELPQDEVPSQAVVATLPGFPARQRPDACARRGMVRLVIAAAVFNGLAYPLIQIMVGTQIRGVYVVSLALMSLVTGVLMGEVAAMACWLVWSDGSFLRRLAVHWGIGCVLFTTLIFGSLLSFAGMPTEWSLFRRLESLTVICCVPVLSLAVQVPLWPFRTHLGWRVLPPDENATSIRDQPLSILDILTGTAVVAVSLGLVRFLPRVPSSVMWTMTLAIALTSFVMLLPAMIFILRMWSVVLGVGLYFGGVVVSVCGLIQIVSLFSNGSPSVGTFLTMIWGSLVFAATVSSPLFVWRACGYRLVWLRDRR
jgi:hypothetical protein